MPVTIEEHVKLKDLDGAEWEGIGVANNLAAIRAGNGDTIFGVVTGLVKVRTSIVCDNPLCVNSKVTEEFTTVPMSIKFDDEGSKDPEFIKQVADVVITSDYKGDKKVFCTAECAAKFLRREHHVNNVVTGPFGKGPREVK